MVDRNRNMKKKYLTWICLLIIVIAFFFIAFNNCLVVTKYTIETEKVNNMIRLAVLTDLHATQYGENQIELINKIKDQRPDAFLLVGDIFDENRDKEPVMELLSAIGTEYPGFYVSGNHEFWSGEVDTWKKMVESYGVTVLEGDTVTIEIHGEKIQISGVDDPDGFLSASTIQGEEKGSWQEQFDFANNSVDPALYSVLLSHRPESVQLYNNSNFDLIVSGHAHGGQIRLPFLMKGLYAPNQGFFPKYSKGLYNLGNANMIVSSGLCKSALPRIFNPPEVVIIDIVPVL